MANLKNKWKLLLSSMDTWVIFVAQLLITWLVSVAETFVDILKHNFVETNIARFATKGQCKLTLVLVIRGWDICLTVL